MDEADRLFVCDELLLTVDVEDDNVILLGLLELLLTEVVDSEVVDIDDAELSLKNSNHNKRIFDVVQL